MNDFPEFMKNPKNAVRKSDQSTIPGIEGYIFDGVDGSQMIIWHCPDGGKSDFHMHDFDEYFVVVQGSFKGKIGERMIELRAGEEIVIPRGISHNGEYSSNFRGIWAFSAKRADRNAD